jgi:hypothetical protein
MMGVAKINAYVPDRLEERIRTLRERGGTINVSEIATSAIEKSVESEERRLAGRPVAAILRRLRALDETEGIRGDGETYGRKWAELKASRKELELVAGCDRLDHFSITGDRVEAVVRCQDKDIAVLPDSLSLAPNCFPQALAELWFDGLFAGARSVLDLVTRATELEELLPKLADEFNEAKRVAGKDPEDYVIDDDEVDLDRAEAALGNAIWEAESMGLDVPSHAYQAITWGPQ